MPPEPISLASTGPAQFNPCHPALIGQPAANAWITNGEDFLFDSDAALLTSRTTGRIVATGRLVNMAFSAPRLRVTYAVFLFPEDIHIGGGSLVTGIGANPVVLLTQKSFLLYEEAIIDFSSEGERIGPGGGGVGQGPGAGCKGHIHTPGPFGRIAFPTFGGGGFGGAGGRFGSAGGGEPYGNDLADPLAPHLQGGSGGAVTGLGGGAIYIAAAGTLTVDNATIRAAGGSIDADSFDGGSGGAIALFGSDGVIFSRAIIEASGGNASGALYGAGGGGRVVVGYAHGSSTPDLSCINVRGGVGTESPGSPSVTGSIYPIIFAGF